MPSDEAAGPGAAAPVGIPAQRSELAQAVDAAVTGDVTTDAPEAQPDRHLCSPQDFPSLYIRHRHAFTAHARRYLNDSRDVDEVVQEAFLRLFLAMPDIETERQAIAFGRRALTNLCIDRYRRDMRRPRLLELDGAGAAAIPADDFDDPVLRAEDAAIVRDALARLSPIHRAALVKREIEEKSYDVIAAELELPEDGVKHLLFRARRALRRLLAGTTVDPDSDPSFRQVAARATGSLKSLFILLIAVAIGVPALHALTHEQPRISDATGAPQSLTPPPVGELPQPYKPGVRATPMHRTAATQVPTRPAAPVVSRPAAGPSGSVHGSGASPDQWRAGKVHHGQGNDNAGSTADSGYVPPVPLPTGFSVTGEARQTAPAKVKTNSIVRDRPGAPALQARSTFVAPTDRGNVSIKQTVGYTDALLAVNVQPTLLIDGTYTTLTPTALAVQRWALPSNDVLVQAVAALPAISNDQDTPGPGFSEVPSAITVTFVLTPTLDRVLAQSVDVGTAAPAAPTPAPATGSPPNASASPAPAASLTPADEGRRDPYPNSVVP